MEEKMNKSELIAQMAEKSDLSKKDSEKALAAFLDTVVDALKNGDKVSLVGFGTFEVRERAARTGLNPRTKEPIEIAASKAPGFKAGKGFKDEVNK
ncbi:HU family DNA-binding protein [uncultured Acetobacterium sp.]|uniref:HU family DNA-binding protein n=1 Tax=uncultured Acetobacterium sp. TaxID=217139 RepID=UPI0025F33265|nr:HU family DNA-binding protein [uncultured Acetobacterium sp.]MDP2842854.1 HU family DNA-binding protein [Acetobacterium sp.]